MQTTAWLPSGLVLVPHNLARDNCVAKNHYTAGSRLLSTTSYATVLLDSEKGRRCDFCLSLAREAAHLKRCSGCGSYWYCNEHCDGSFEVAVCLY